MNAPESEEVSYIADHMAAWPWHRRFAHRTRLSWRLMRAALRTLFIGALLVAVSARAQDIGGYTPPAAASGASLSGSNSWTAFQTFTLGEGITQGQKLCWDAATCAKYFSSDGTVLTLTGLNFSAPKVTSTAATGVDSVIITKGARIQLNSTDDANNNTISSSANGVITFGTGATEIDASTVQANYRSTGVTPLLFDNFTSDGASAVAMKIRIQAGPFTNAGARLLRLENPANTIKLSWDSNAKMVYPTGGSADVVGRAVLVAGTVTVSTTAVTASSVVQLTRCVGAGTAGLPQVGTVTAATSFVINSVQPGTSSTVQSADTSTICWSLIN